MMAQSSLRRTALARLLAAAAAGGLTSAALAQDALGDGTLRGANEQLRRQNAALAQPGGQLYLPTRPPPRARLYSLTDDLAFRNAIVTGNVTGGRQFRGEVGYTAAADFRGDLGSDDIFSFQARSLPPAMSPLAGPPLPGQVSPAQLSLGYSVAGQSVGLGRGLIVQRPGAGPTSAEVIGAPGADVQALSVDAYGRFVGGLRAPSTFEQRAAAEPSFVGAVETESGGRVAYLSNSVLGVKPFSQAGYQATIRQRDARLRELGISPDLLASISEERARAEEAALLERGLAEPATVPLESEPLTAAPYADLRTALRLEPPRPDAPAETEGEGDDATPDPAAPPPPAFDALLDERFDILREALSRDAGADADAAPPGLRPFEPALTNPGQDPEPAAPAAPPDAADEPDESGLLDDIGRMLAGEAVSIDRFTASNVVNTVFDLHVASGQEALAEQRWFDAEERFTAALLLRPGDPMASAGRVNAQLAAGMLRSAEINLRAMLKAYPEMAAARFDESLLPRGERRERVLERLRNLTNDADRPTRRAAALLRAYAGRQFDLPGEVRAAFEVLDETRDPAEPPDRLLDLLRTAWRTPEAAAPHE